MTTFRQESDSMGTLDVPEHALYKAQTQRAVNNFPISGITMPSSFIKALRLYQTSRSRNQSIPWPSIK